MYCHFETEKMRIADKKRKQMKVRVIAEDNIIISNMMMMMISRGFSYRDWAVVISSVAILSVCHQDDDQDDDDDDDDNEGRTRWR